ncbi:MAG: magnesium transporter [Gemmatimonadota bacterium]
MTEATSHLRRLVEQGATEELYAYIHRLVEEKAEAELAEQLGTLHGSDVADVLEHLEEEERVYVLSVLPAPIASESLVEMEEVEHPGELLTRLEPERIAELVTELADDDAADLIGELEPADQARVLSSLPDVEEEEIVELLHFPEDTAGGIMTREVVSLPLRMTAGQALQAVRAQGRDVGHFYTIFVVEPHQRLRGVVSLQRLVMASPEQPIDELVEESPVVDVEMDQEEVGRVLARYNLPAIGVVDPRGRLVGRITFDDVIDVLEAETTEDILRFASVSEEEAVLGTTRDAVRGRLPWLVVNLFTAVVAASVVYVFQRTIQEMVILAAVMPIIAGMGGNAGTQALAVTVRRIALSRETVAERWKVLGKELLVGVLNGLVIGSIVAVTSFLLVGEPLFGLVVMLAMWGNLVVASFAGAFIPIFLERLGVDPAVASSIFVTTLTDLCGFFLLLGLATALLL